MGAWGTGILENDSALDFLGELENYTTLTFVKKKLQTLLNQDEIEAFEAEEALAGIEIIKAMIIKESESDTILEWIDIYTKKVPEDLISLADQIIDKIVQEESEISELWKESELYEEWKSNVYTLKSQLHETPKKKKRLPRKKNGDIYAVRVEEKQGYIYVYYITGNKYGHILVVYDYFTKELESDMEKILSQKSLYEQVPIIGYIDPYDEHKECMTLVGNKKPNYAYWSKQPIYLRESIKKNWYALEHYFNKPEDYQQEQIKKGIQHQFDDWELSNYHIDSVKGKLTAKPLLSVGTLTPEQRKIFSANTLACCEDFIDMYLQGYDSNTMMCNLFI